MSVDLSKQVKIRISTYDRLTARGRKSETYDDIINRLMDVEDNVIKEGKKGGGKGKTRKGEWEPE
jgi:hypothetical protein